MKTMTAKAVYKLSGWASHIKSPSRIYKIEFDGPDKLVAYGKPEWRWGPAPFTWRLLRWSMRLDPTHWDHWALEHKGCGASYCMDCKGYSCGDDDRHGLEAPL